MSSNTPRVFAGAGVLFTAAFLSVFFSPEQILNIADSPTHVDILPIIPPTPVISQSCSDSLDEIRRKLSQESIKLQQQTGKVQELEDTIKELREQVVKAKVGLEKCTLKPIGPAKPSNVPKTGPKLENEWTSWFSSNLNSYGKKISPRFLSVGWTLDVVNSVTIYTVALMFLRSLYDFFNPEQQEDAEQLKRILSQKSKTIFLPSRNRNSKTTRRIRDK